MIQTNLVEDFIRENVVKSGLNLQKPDIFRTHVQLLMDDVAERGWTAEKISKNLYSIYRRDELIGSLQQMLTSLTSSTAVSICSRKHVARQLFAEAGVPIADGASFNGEQWEEAISYFETTRDAVVMKPSRGAAGKGVTTNISSREDFEYAWRSIYENQTKAASVVVERQVPGVDIRVFVVGGKIIAASTRLPAFTVGDGTSTLSSLIEATQRNRAESAYLRRMPIVVDEKLLARKGLNAHSVIDEGRIVILNMAFNIHQGGTNLDLTNSISEEVGDIALRAADAVPGLAVSGVDLMVQDIASPVGSVVLEANTAANIAVHHYPAYGDMRNVAGAILDEMERNSHR